MLGIGAGKFKISGILELWAASWPPPGRVQADRVLLLMCSVGISRSSSELVSLSLMNSEHRLLGVLWTLSLSGLT